MTPPNSSDDRSPDQGLGGNPGSKASPGASKLSPPIGYDPGRMSDEAIILAFGWFSFGSKASVTINPPHAAMAANKAALDELLAAELITHEHEHNKRFGIDRHHFKGTAAIGDLLKGGRAKAVLMAALTKAGAQ